MRQNRAMSAIHLIGLRSEHFALSKCLHAHWVNETHGKADIS